MENFEIKVNYQRLIHQFGIRRYSELETNTDYHDVWKDVNFLFTIIPRYDNEILLKWKDKNTLSAIDNRLIEKISESIENHDL